MDPLNPSDILDHQKWLINNNLINDQHKDNIYLFGAILHKDIEALDVDIDPTNKVIKYNIYANKNLHKLLNKYNKLRSKDNIIALWRLKRLLKKQGSLDFKRILEINIKKYCGQAWRVELEIDSIGNYKDVKPEEVSPRVDGQN